MLSKRFCSKCDDITDRLKDGHCAPCNKRHCALRYQLRGKEYRDSRRLRQTGCSPELYNELYLRQKGCCECCGDFHLQLVADHDHTTEQFRGFLCTPCNLMLGHAKDNPTRLRQGADYLERK